jgi:hypothetical protein
MTFESSIKIFDSAVDMTFESADMVFDYVSDMKFDPCIVTIFDLAVVVIFDPSSPQSSTPPSS